MVTDDPGPPRGAGELCRRAGAVRSAEPGRSVPHASRAAALAGGTGHGAPGRLSGL